MEVKAFLPGRERVALCSPFFPPTALGGFPNRGYSLGDVCLGTSGTGRVFCGHTRALAGFWAEMGGSGALGERG